ncbi:glycosyltransferase [Pseudomonas helleri]|uniref:glycosyltransferase n=1 Tax=Pseudomonas helleri TaxID=1608996 RepID=UPI0038012484
MNTDISQKIQRLDVYDIANNLGYRTTDRSDSSAFTLAMKIIAQLLRECSVTDLSKEQCADPLFLKTFCTQLSVRRTTALAVGSDAEKAGHQHVHELVSKLANLILSLECPLLIYPLKHPNQTTRAAFREAIVAKLSSFALSQVMSECTTHFIANLLDLQHLNKLQRVLINRLRTDNGIEMLMARQPSLMDCLYAELMAIFTNLPDTLMLANFNSLWFVDSEGNNVPDQSLTSLIQRSLTASAAPPLLPREIRYQTQLNPLQDNYLSITATQFKAFWARIKSLDSTYIESLKRYWATPADNQAGAPTKEQDYVTHYRLLLETQLQLLCADGSLDENDDTAIRNMIFQPPYKAPNKLRAGRLAILNAPSLTPRRCSFTVAFKVRAPTVAAFQTTYVFTPQNGFEVFASTRQANAALNRRLNDRHTLPDWVENVALEYKAETVFFNRHTPKTLKVESLRTNTVEALIAFQLEQNYQDIATVFKQFRALETPPKPAYLSTLFDQATRRTSAPTTEIFVNARTHRVIQRTPTKAIAQAFFILHEPDNELPVHRPLPVPNIANEFKPSADLQTLITDAQFKTFASDLLAKPAHKTLLRQVLDEGLDWIPESFPMTAETGLKLVHKYVSHSKAVPEIDSLNHRVIIAVEQGLRKNTFFTADYHYLTSCFLMLGSPPDTGTSLEPVSSPPGASAKLSVPTSTLDIHAHISGVEPTRDITALTEFLQVPTFLPALKLPDSEPLSGSRLMSIVVDSPAFHQLEQAVVGASSWTTQERKIATPGMIRTLTLTCITDYLCPPERHSEGYVCGLNLNTPAMGGHSIQEVRRQVMEQLRSTLHCKTKTDLQVAFELIAGRYCPQLMVYDVPQDLRYGYTPDSIHFRHAVALAESAHPGAAVALGYERLSALLNATFAQSMTPDEQLAITVLRREPVLHFAMCRGKIPVTDTADVDPADVITALQYVSDLEEQKATAMTALVQPPPDRKQMALKQLSNLHPPVNARARRRFTDAAIHEYFIPRFKNRGRNMHLSLLEQYITCGQGRAFTDKVLGFDSKGLGGCALLSAFNEQFDAFQVQYNSAVKVQLIHAINDLPPEQRKEVLSANHFLTASFAVEGNKTAGYYGLLALSTRPDDTYVYEIFCPSGTIRKVEPEASGYIVYDLQEGYALDKALSVSGLPKLDQMAYLDGKPGALRATPTLALSLTWNQQIDKPEEERVEQLCEQMVNAAFSKSLSQLRTAFSHPTPYEQYKDELANRAELIFKVIIPFYSLYRDIEGNKVNAWTVIFAALEILSFVVPFGKGAYSGFQASVAVGKIVLRGTSFGVSKFALASMRTLYASKAFATTAGKGLISAANPLALGGLLFRGGLKGVGFIQRKLQTHKALNNVTTLVQLKTQLNPEAAFLSASTTPFIQPKTINSGLATPPVTPFNPDFSWGNRKLSVAQQRLFHIEDIDLSGTQQIDNIYQVAGLSYIKMQGNIFSVVRSAGGTSLNLYKGSINGPTVRFNAAEKIWELATSGLTGGMETSSTVHVYQRQLSVPMDNVFNLNAPSSAPNYAIEWNNYTISVVYDAGLATWREQLRYVDNPLGDAVWLDAEGKWHKGSVATFNSIRSSLPPPKEMVSLTLPLLPQLPQHPQAIPNSIHYIWVGTQAPGTHLVEIIAKNMKLSTEFTSTLHLDVSDALYIQIEFICQIYAPKLKLSKIREEAFYEVFKKSSNAEQYTTIFEAEHKTWSAASDVIRFPLINHYGGLYLDLDDVLSVPLVADDIKAGPHDLLLGGVVKESALDFEGYNTSHFASHSNNNVLTAISAEMHKRFLDNRAFYSQAKPVLDKTLSGEALVKNQEAFKTYHKKYFQLTGPALMNYVLLDKIPAVYNTVFQLMPKYNTVQALGVHDFLHNKHAIDCTNHFFPFADKYPITVGSEHSWE